MVDEIMVREAALADRLEIWEWWNDPVTRSMMKLETSVPWEEHSTWFERDLADDDLTLCIGLVGSQKIGVVRFDRQAERVYDVSINLNPQCRGKGYAPRILSESVAYFRRSKDPKLLFAMLKKINIPSKKSFAKAGFTYAVGPPPGYPRSPEFDGETELYCELKFD
ncbi:GNAT family N-acetyltransferase [Dehalococcoidia bacterium]|nr:GNAT family N-acetyltransferase [Dehalococcoidia bacterium]